MQRSTFPVRLGRLGLVCGLVLVVGLVLVLLREAHLQREAAWSAGCGARGGWVESVPGPTNPLVVGSDAPTRTCWSADGRVLDRRR